MLSVHHISCQRGRQILWQDLSFETPPSSLTFVRGANGQGKSSLLRILTGLSTPHAGEVRWQGELLKKVALEFHQSMTYLGHTIPLKGDLDAVQNLQFLLQVHGLSATEAAIKNTLHHWGLAAKTIRLPAKFLSQGQKQRVCLAQLHLAKSTLWILDEPFNGLDTNGSAILLEAFATHLHNKGSVVLTSHLHSRICAPESPLAGFAEQIIELKGAQ